VNWDSFVDVEEEKYAVHHSGIHHYEVAIGQFSYLILKNVTHLGMSWILYSEYVYTLLLYIDDV